MADPRDLSPSTLAVTAGRPERTPGAPVNEPLTWTSTYVADGPVDYARGGNPVWTAFEEVLGRLEGGRATLFASGMGAIAAALAGVPHGGVVVAPRHAYSGTSALLAEREAAGALVVRRVDVADTGAVVTALDGAELLWLETPTNPMLEVADLGALCAAARSAGATSVVDSTFATPLVQRPLDHGADVVVHSVTKYLAGHSDVVLGATVARDDALVERLVRHRLLHGAIPGPAEAWLALRGLRTLPLRMERAQASATELARRLASCGHPALERVRHPSLPDDPGHEVAGRQMHGGYGAIVALEVRGGAAAAERVAAATTVWLHATSLGGVESTLERRRRHTAEVASVPEGLLRLSVGVEDVEDLWADLLTALDAAR